MKGLRIVLTGLLCFSLATVFAQLDADAIIAKMDKTVFAIKDRTVDMQMLMANTKSGNMKIKEAVLMQKGTDRKLFRYTAPESDAGISTLSLPSGEIYVYLPMFKKPKKVTNLAESGIFNSSDFSIEDMVTQPYADKYNPKLLGSEGNTYTVDLIPKAEDPNWKHVVAHVDKKNFYPVRLDYYNKKDELEKQAKYRYTNVNGFWVTEELSMEDFKKQHKTTLYMSNIRVNTGLSDDLFTLENLVPEGEEE